MAPAEIFETASLSSRWLITAATLAYGAGPFVVDMNRTHLLHPAWPGHARFHLAWAAVAQLLTGFIVLGLVWSAGPYLRWRCTIALLIGISHVGAFFIAWAAARFYRGTLHDAGGMKPFHGIDGNVVACLLIGGLLVAAWVVL